MIAHAASAGTVAAQSLIARLNDAIIYPALSLGMAVAAVVFAWGIFQYVQTAKSGTALTQGRDTMLWSIVGFVIMVSAYAILKIVTGTLGIDLPG